jgi:hypothetical protein
MIRKIVLNNIGGIRKYHDSREAMKRSRRDTGTEYDFGYELVQ